LPTVTSFERAERPAPRSPGNLAGRLEEARRSPSGFEKILRPLWKRKKPLGAPAAADERSAANSRRVRAFGSGTPLGRTVGTPKADADATSRAGPEVGACFFYVLQEHENVGAASPCGARRGRPLGAQSRNPFRLSVPGPNEDLVKPKAPLRAFSSQQACGGRCGKARGGIRPRCELFHGHQPARGASVPTSKPTIFPKTWPGLNPPYCSVVVHPADFRRSEGGFNPRSSIRTVPYRVPELFGVKRTRARKRAPPPPTCRRFGRLGVC